MSMHRLLALGLATADAIRLGGLQLRDADSADARASDSASRDATTPSAEGLGAALSRLGSQAGLRMRDIVQALEEGPLLADAAAASTSLTEAQMRNNDRIRAALVRSALRAVVIEKRPRRNVQGNLSDSVDTHIPDPDLFRDFGVSESTLDKVYNESLTNFTIHKRLGELLRGDEFQGLVKNKSMEIKRHAFSISDYLAAVYKMCRNIPFLRHAFPFMEYSDLRARYAPPVLAYAPYVTTFPLFYITDGGQRLSQFGHTFEHFSPTMVRIDAYVPSGDNESDALALNESFLNPEDLLDRVKKGAIGDWKKVLGCLVSHLQAIKTAWDSGMSQVIIVEDDAVPMYPAWRGSLEEFVLMLPDDWEAVQLQWSITVSSKFEEKDELVKKSTSWREGRGWGTAAYMLHRRGMERLLGELWSSEVGKFNLDKLSRKCKRMSADDCLLGFTGYTKKTVHYKEILWMPNKELPLMKVFVAEPPLFLHDSFSTPVHGRNYCQDVRQNVRLLEQHEPPSGAERLLIFLCADPAGDASMDNMRRSVSYLRKAGYNFFVAYGDDLSKLPKPSERKFLALQQYWLQFGEYWKTQYDYIWPIDADIVLSDVNLSRVVDLANESQAAIASPALATPSTSTAKEQDPAPADECKLRYANHVDVAAPIFQTWAVTDILSSSNGTLYNASLVGPSVPWCELLHERTGARCSTPLSSFGATTPIFGLPPSALEDGNRSESTTVMPTNETQ